MFTNANFKVLHCKATAFILLVFALMLCQSASAAETTKVENSGGTSIWEILGYIGMVLGVVLLAWFIGAAQSKDSTKNINPGVSHKRHKHFEHPNDPHFRKLKKKTR